MPILVQLAGLWIARDIAAGKYPAKFAVPLGFLISRLGAPGLLVGAIGLAMDQFADRNGTKRKRPARRTSKRPAGRKTAA